MTQRAAIESETLSRNKFLLWYLLPRGSLTTHEVSAISMQPEVLLKSNCTRHHAKAWWLFIYFLNALSPLMDYVIKG